MSNIIVSVKDEHQTFSFDMEIPVNASLKKTGENILEALDTLMPGLNFNIRWYMLTHNRTGQKLEGEKTVEDAGIWNGDYITMTVRR